MTTNEYIYETSDLGLAASLTASGFPIHTIDKSNPRRVIFRFNSSEELDSAVDSYWSNTLLLPAQDLLGYIKILKSRIYS